MSIVASSGFLSLSARGLAARDLAHRDDLGRFLKERLEPLRALEGVVLSPSLLCRGDLAALERQLNGFLGIPVGELLLKGLDAPVDAALEGHDDGGDLGGGSPGLEPQELTDGLVATTVSSSGGCLPSPGFLPSAASLRALFSSMQAESASRICSSPASSPRPSAAASFLMSSFMLVLPPSNVDEFTIGVMPAIAGVLVRAREWRPVALLSVLRTVMTGER